jgi:hypothetical protein
MQVYLCLQTRQSVVTTNFAYLLSESSMQLIRAAIKLLYNNITFYFYTKLIASARECVVQRHYTNGGKL